MVYINNKGGFIVNNLPTNSYIEHMIFEIRGKQVILDRDLALLYQCTNGTKDINKSVNRNLNKFPEDFYFQLTKEETLQFQIGTANMSRLYLMPLRKKVLLC